MAKEDHLQSTTNYFPTITLSGSLSENDYSDIKSQSGSVTNGYELSPSSKSIVLSQNIFVVLVDFTVHSHQRNNYIFKILPNQKSRHNFRNNRCILQCITSARLFNQIKIISIR